MASRRTIFSLALVITVLGGGALYAFYGSNKSRPPAQGNSSAGSGVSVPVVTSEALAEPFAIRRRTIGILESPATVVVKSRIESQVIEQHVKDGQLVKKGDLLFTPRRSRSQGGDRARRGAACQGPGDARPHRPPTCSATSSSAEKNAASHPAARPGDRRPQDRAGNRRGRPGAVAHRQSAARLHQDRGADRRPRRRHPRDAGQPRQRERPDRAS